MSVTGVGWVTKNLGDHIRALLAPKKCDHRASVEDAVHRRLLSLATSERFAAAKAMLLVSTWAYLPSTASTRFRCVLGRRVADDCFRSVFIPESIPSTEPRATSLNAHASTELLIESGAIRSIHSLRRTRTTG
jgi:hypothetical protein